MKLIIYTKFNRLRGFDAVRGAKPSVAMMSSYIELSP